jgi:two-component system invasion response regulator UvrY
MEKSTPLISNCRGTLSHRLEEVMVKILVVDDHPLVRQGIRGVLQNEFGACEIVDAANSHDALDAIGNHAWSVVLLDISLPGRNGIEVLKDIKAVRPQLPVLMFSAHPESLFAVRSLRAGAAGYLNKQSRPDTMIAAIRQAMAGKRFISPMVAEQLADELNLDTSKPLHESLSDREHDVMLKLGAGATVSDVAAALNLSVKTISTYRCRILEKMRMTNNAQLSQYAIRNNLIDISN